MPRVVLLCLAVFIACDVPDSFVTTKASQPASGVDSPAAAAAEIAPATETLAPQSTDSGLFVDTAVDSARLYPDRDAIGVLIPRRFDAPGGGSAVENYLLYLPPDLTKQEDWPVILYLHGRSLRGSDLELIKRYGLPWLLEQGQELPFIVVAPQLPAGERWTDTNRLTALLEDALRGLPVDRGRIYVTGYSMGAGGAWRMAIAQPDLFTAAAPIAATTPEPSAAAMKALVHMPVLVYHGTADTDASYADAAEMVRALQAHGAPARLMTLPGADHNIVNRVYQDPSLYSWLLSHQRASLERK